MSCDELHTIINLVPFSVRTMTKLLGCYEHRSMLHHNKDKTTFFLLKLKAQCIVHPEKQTYKIKNLIREVIIKKAQHSCIRWWRFAVITLNSPKMYL